MMKLKTSASGSTATLDAYFELSRKSVAYRRRVSIEIWNTLSIKEKRALQGAARKLAGKDLKLGAEHTRSLLLLRHVTAGQP